MARKEKEPKIKLKQPDRSGPDPTQETLLEMAEKRGLLKDPAVDVEESNEEAAVGRFGVALLWSISLTMLHFTLDVLVANQYAVDIVWPKLLHRGTQAFPIILFFMYAFHPHPSPPIFLPRLPARAATVLHQLLFFVGAIVAGCYLIHITNMHGYYAVMKLAPPMGCLWIWSVIELDIYWATGSLICCGIYLKSSGHSLL